MALLAALFLMHGSPALATEQEAVPRFQVATPTLEGGVGHLSVAALSSADAATAHEGARTDHGSTSHTTASHLWKACLAVLLMGMVLFAEAAFRRLPPSADRWVIPRVLGSTDWVHPPRPPDLAALCVLRT